jgi:hypothetical protein
VPVGEPLTVSAIKTAPAHGTATLVKVGTVDKEVKYTPNTDYCGVDTFVYTASAPATTGAVTDDAMVMVTVCNTSFWTWLYYIFIYPFVWFFELIGVI